MNRRMFAIQGGLAGAALLLSRAATAGDEREDKEKMKHTIDNLMMFSIAVTDMPKAKAFYSDKLGLKVQRTPAGTTTIGGWGLPSPRVELLLSSRPLTKT
jgi:hypothetical protein